MSSVNELSEIFESLQNLPEDLQKSITSKFAKLSGLKQLTGETTIQRDGSRLDARQRAYYKKMGLELPEDGEMITNILADNITIGEDPVIAKQNVSPQPEKVTVKPSAPPQPQQPVQPPPAQKPNVTPTWLKWALAAAIGASAAGPAITAYVMRPTEEQAGGSIFRFDTELPPWMEPENDAP